MRTFSSLAIALIALSAMMVLMGLHLYQTVQSETFRPWFDPNHCEGISAEINQRHYTLGFEQTKTTLRWLSKSRPNELKAKQVLDDTLPFDTLTIYRFDQPDLVLYPVDKDPMHNLTFRFTYDGQSGYLKEESFGTLLNLLTASIEP